MRAFSSVCEGKMVFICITVVNTQVRTKNCNILLTAAQPDLVKGMFIVFCGFEALAGVMWF